MDVVVKDAGKKGRGVFALRDFQKDELILYVKGDVIETDSLDSLPKYEYYHCFPINQKGRKVQYVLPNPPWEFVNHSCDPNAGIKNNRDIVAIKPIKKGDEITFDYAMVAIDDWTMQCHCGSSKCRKIISTFDVLDEETKKKYYDYILDCMKQ